MFVKKYSEFFRFKGDNYVKQRPRDPTKIMIPFCNTKLIKTNVYHMCITIFNKLPRVISLLNILEISSVTGLYKIVFIVYKNSYNSHNVQ